MSRYLVTGGAGFIGSHLCEMLLAQDHEVIVLDNLSTGSRDNLPTKVTFIEGDICNQALVQHCMEQVAGCFHLAAIASVEICHEYWRESTHVNLGGTLNIFAAAKANSVRLHPIPIVMASSAAVYGNCEKLPCKEQDLVSPISSYGLDKLASEQYAHFAGVLENTPITLLRLFNVYGPRQQKDSAYSGVITKFATQLLHNEPITFYGDAKQTRDFIYVKDVAQAFCEAMASLPHPTRILNVCSGKSTSIEEIAIILSEILNKTPEIIHENPRRGDIQHSLGCPEQAEKVLGFSAKTSLEEGLRHFLSYQR